MDAFGYMNACSLLYYHHLDGLESGKPSELSWSEILTTGIFADIFCQWQALCYRAIYEH